MFQDTQSLMGNFLDPIKQYERDAIHVPVFPVTAGETMLPGQRVSISDDGIATISGKTVAIIDPYLDSAVKKGDVVFVQLFPNKVTGMRHFWHHPEFDNTPPPSGEYTKVTPPAPVVEEVVVEVEEQTDEEHYSCCPSEDGTDEPVTEDTDDYDDYYRCCPPEDDPYACC